VGGQQSLPLLVLRARSKAIRVSGEAGRELLNRPGCDRSVMRGGLHGDQGASRWVAGDLADIDTQRCTTDQARPEAVNTAAALFNNNYRGVAHSAASSLVQGVPAWSRARGGSHAARLVAVSVAV
jgi:hypothetical protein